MSKLTRAYIDQLRQAARQELRRKACDGELLRAPRFAEQLGISLRELARLESKGDVFSVDVDGTPHYPALLASPSYDPRRLRKVCRIIFPASASMRWDYLTTAWDSLGGLTPLEAMQSDDGYHRLLTDAKSWAAQGWRTTVEIYVGGYANRGTCSALVCTGAVEMDPRVSVWRRAADALSCNMRPDGPYPRLSAATVIATNSAAGASEPVREFELDVTVSEGMSYASVVGSGVTPTRLGPVLVDEADDILAIVRKLLLATAPRPRHRTC